MSSYGVVGRVGLLVEPTFRGAQRKVRDGLGVPLAKEGSKQGRNLGDMIVSGTTRVFKWGGVAVGAALGTAITKGFGRIRAMEDATAKIEGLGYSAKEVDQIMSDVQGALDGTMFLYSEGADVAAGALAAGVSEGKELENYLRLTADAATQANIPFGDMGHMMNKVSSSGKLTGDVLMQLEQNGVYVGAAIADSLGVTQEEFRKMVSAGEVSADVFMEVMEDQFAGSSEKAAETMTGAMSLAWTAVGQLGEKLIQHVYPYLKEFFQAFYDWVQDISPAVEDFGERVGKALGAVIGWLTENPGAVKAFAAAISSVFAAMAAYTVVVKLKDAFKALNISMAANPVGLWIAGIAALVTALIWAWNNVDWFRNGIITAWEWIADASIWLWDNVLADGWNRTVALFKWLGGVFVSVWQNILQPVFQGIGTVVTWLWSNIIQPYFSFIWGLWMSLGEVFVAVWNNVLAPVFSWFGDIAMWLWEHALSPVFSWIGDKWQYVVLGMQFYWEMVLKPVFMALATVAQWLWESVLSPVFSWIGEHWSTVMDIMKWAWDAILRPVWVAISTVALWLWNSVLSPVFTWIGNRWSNMIDGMVWVWENILEPVWNVIATVAMWLWEKVLEPVFTWIGNHWHLIVDGMVWVWDHILHPAWLGIKAVAMWLWEKILKKVFTWIGDHWEEIVFGMKYAWEEYLKPAWERMSSVASWLWEKLSDIFTWIGNKWSSMKDRIVSIYDKYISPVFGWFGDKVEALKDRFGTAVDNIKKAWDRMKSVAAKPINFVITRVINEGLIQGFNKIAEHLPGVNKLKGFKPPKWVHQYGYATGGWTGPGSRLTPAGFVHADEYVVRKASRGPFERENPGLLDHINRHGTLAGYAKGGMVRPVKGGRFTSGFGAGRGRYSHAGQDIAVPIGTPVYAAMDGTVLGHQPPGRTGRYVFLSHPGGRNTYYGHLSRALVSPGDTVKQGQRIALSGNTGNSTGPHLHYETWTGGRPVNPLAYLSGAALPEGAEGAGGIFDPLAPFRALGDKITGWVEKQFPDGGMMPDLGIGAAKKTFDSILDWASSKVSSFGDSDGGSSIADADARATVQSLAAKYGWGSGAQWNALDQLVSRESSWNPRAKNPSSSAAGLFQKMTSLHGPLESSVEGQAKWGLNYIRRQYGDPLKALFFHKNRGWYDTGGHVDPLFRDKGGNLPPGLSMVLNKTGQDEAILNARQWSDIHTLAQRGAGSGAAVNIQNAYALSSEQLARDITKQQRRAQALQLI